MATRASSPNPEAKIRIRKSELTDAHAIAGLVTQLGYPTTPADMAARLEAMVADRGYVTFVAETPDRVVGLVGARLGVALEFSRPYARLTGLVVDRGWRGRGIGTLLMDHIEAWARARGAASLILTSSNHRHEAHRLYTKLGYQETGRRFAKGL